MYLSYLNVLQIIDVYLIIRSQRLGKNDAIIALRQLAKRDLCELFKLCHKIYNMSQRNYTTPYLRPKCQLKQ